MSDVHCSPDLCTSGSRRDRLSQYAVYFVVSHLSSKGVWVGSCRDCDALVLSLTVSNAREQRIAFAVPDDEAGIQKAFFELAVQKW